MADTLIYRNGEWVPLEEPDTLIYNGKEWVPDTSVDFDLGTMVKNIPGSAKRVVTDTVSGLASLPGAATDLFAQLKVGETEGAKQAGSALVDYYKDRYGGVDEIKQTAMDDPVGMALDVIPAGVGSVKTAAKVGKAADRFARSNYERLAKFGTTIDPDSRAAMIDTGLREGLYPTAAGAKKAEGLIGELNAVIGRQIAEATAAGTVIPADAVLVHLKNLRQKVGGMKLEGGADLKKIEKIEKAFRDHLKDVGRDYFTPDELQAFKVDLYQKVSYNAKRGKGNKTRDDARKAAARAAREELEKASPGIADVNARLGDLYELQPNLERAASRTGNRNWLSLTGTLGGGIAGSSAGIPGGVLGALAGSIAMSPMAARGLTRASYGVGKALKGLPDPTWFTPMAAGYGFTMPGRIDDEDE